jgi:hypothetical protein
MPIPAATDDTRYHPIPTTMPLLHEHEPSGSRNRISNDDDHQELSQQWPRTTPNDTSPQSQSTSTTNVPSRPPAPPPPPAYFEVTANDDDIPLSAQTYYPPSSILSSSASTFSTSVPLLAHHNPSSTSMLPEPTTRGRNRQSGFRTFLNRMSMSMPGAPSGTSAGHQRTESSNSNTSTTSFFRRPGSSLSSTAIHHTRQNPSISQSGVSHFSSPSTISINSLSISAPLTHTASRTQFTFPQPTMSMASASTTTTAGVVMMTPDQVRVIAAREAIGRFGLPYGPDAVAFAAAKGGPPPPGFDEVVGSGVLEEEDEGRGDASASATVRVHSPERQSILEPSVYTNGISSSPTTPTPIPLSEFGQIPTSSSEQQLLSPGNNNVLRSESISSNFSSQTYATAVESLSVPLTTTTATGTAGVDTTNSSRSSSYRAVGGGGGDVVRGWSSSSEEEVMV